MKAKGLQAARGKKGRGEKFAGMANTPEDDFPSLQCLEGPGGACSVIVFSCLFPLTVPKPAQGTLAGCGWPVWEG